MITKFKHYHFILIISCFYSLTFFSQTTPEVKVDINSGNPAFPFPQFLPYESATHFLDNLASKNAVGVVHAEMEQSIRDAWQIFANSFKYSNTTYSGVRYVRGNIGCPYDCSEGDGYALLAAAEMADKTTFDGLWFRTHDVRMVKQPRYQDCIIPDPGYQYGEFSLKDNTDSAGDGDVDIALSLLIAYKQWGENSGYNDACGKPINYKEEALKVIRGLVERTDRGLGDCRRVSGIIGFDGYMKGGNTWRELTTWASALTPECPEFKGPNDQHIDYYAPSYFHAFTDFLTKNGDVRDQGWNINQFKRAETSSDWLMGKMLDNPTRLPLAGWVNLSTNTPIYSNFSDGEDFRNPWRTVLNYVWHGDPVETWNPTTHQVETGTNSFEQNVAKRLARFMEQPGKSPWNNACTSVGGGPSLSYDGPSQLKYYYDVNTGKENTTFNLNWLAGTGSPAAVASQNFELMAKLYRQCEIEWDVTTTGDGYLTSVPGYFHGFFRLLGMLTLSGNHHSPAEIIKEANVKVYHSVDKTFAFVGDELEFTIDYRNYSSIDAKDVQLNIDLPKGFDFVSASNSGKITGSNVSWNIGTVPGFKSNTGVFPTTGKLTLKVKINKNASDRICTNFKISTSNGKGWTSNEYPNNKTAVMERNCVDIADKALEIQKKATVNTVNVGDEVTYTINFENASRGGFLNGGRSGVIPAYAHDGHAGKSNQALIKIRLYHGADESYIDYGNYRISLFLNDNAVDCVQGESGCAGTSWVLDSDIYEGGDRSKVKITSEKIIPGSDVNGAWNQRVIVKFSNQLATITPHISRYFGLTGRRVHLGGAQPLRAVWRMHTNTFSDVQWDDDWSWNPTFSDNSGGLFFPVTNDWTDPNKPNVPVTVYHNEACEKPTKTIDNILIEEWDGFTWRRVFGNSPVPGREVENVKLVDKLPQGFTFLGFVDNTGSIIGNSITVLGEIASYDKSTHSITWNKNSLLVKQKGTFSYKLSANFLTKGACPRPNEKAINTVSIEAKNESPIKANAEVIVTCTPVILPPPPSSMTKTVVPLSGIIGDNVTYNLSYENVDGSNFTSSFNETWTTQSGSPMALTPNIGISSNFNQSSVFTNDLSHGKNGSIIASINFNDNQAFGFALRHTGGTIANGVYVVFKPNFGSGSIEVKVYDGIREIKSTTLTASSNPATIKVQLNKDQLQLWIGNITNPIPTWSVLGIPEKTGYTGFINGFPDGSATSGKHDINSFISHMDSAFNLQITDPIPNELTFVLASNSGINNAGVVTYPIVKGPILQGTILNYTWEAKIASCTGLNSKIVNEAYTNGLGLPKNFIRAQAILDCSGATSCLSVVPDPIVAIPSFCEGELVKDITTYITTIGTLVWYANLTDLLPITKPVIDTSTPTISPIMYYVSQQDAIGCESNRVLVEVTVKPKQLPLKKAITIASGTKVNYDIFTTLGFTKGAIEWVIDANNTAVTGGTTTIVRNDMIDDLLINTSTVNQDVIYTITETIGATACDQKTAKVTVTITPPVTPLSVTISPSTVIEGNPLVFDLQLSSAQTGDTTLKLELTHVTTDNTDFTLFTKEVEVTITANNVLGLLTLATIDDTVVENNESVEVTLLEINGIPPTITTLPVIGTIKDNDTVCPIIPTPVVSNTHIKLCETDAIVSLSSFVTAKETLVWYSSNTSSVEISEPIIDPSKLTPLNSYFVGQKNATNCESSRVEIQVEIVPIPTLINDSVTIKSDRMVDYDIITKLGFDKDNVEWTVDVDNSSITGVSNTIIKSNVINDLVSNTSTINQDVIYTIKETNGATDCDNKLARITVTVTPKEKPIVVTLNPSTVIEGDPLMFIVKTPTPQLLDITLKILVTPITTNANDFLAFTREEVVILRAGSVTETVLINTFDDALIETTETVELRLTEINGTATTVLISTIGAIKDNDTICPVIPTPTVVDNNIELCSNDIAFSLGTIVSVTETIVWYDSAVSLIEISEPIIDPATFNTTITYFVAQKNANDCESNRVPITVNALMVNKGVLKKTINSGEIVNFDILSQIPQSIASNQIRWKAIENNQINGETTFDQFSNEINDTLFNNTRTSKTLTYTIQGFSENNCTILEYDVIVTINPKPIIEEAEFPNFFTPNNDSTNDYWNAYEEKRSLIKRIHIFNRYGKLMFSFNPEINRGWGGIYQGKLVPATDYWYYAVFKNKKTRRGHFSLIR